MGIAMGLIARLLLLVVIIPYGLVLGTVINYLADVLPEIRKLSRPFCLRCSAPVDDWINYFTLRPCSYCGGKRPRRNLIILIVSAATCIFLWMFSPIKLGFGIASLIFAFFGMLAVIDIEHRLVLYVTSLFGMVIGFALGLYAKGLVPTLIGGAAGFGVMLVLYFLGELFAVILSRIRKETIDEVALGFGDVMLSGVLGLMLGWPLITMCLFSAIVLGGLVSLGYVISMLANHRYKALTALPYAPFLLASATVLLYILK
jgi:leader peptidase (prepilin peptidase)/N-methyltransferase